MGVSGRTEDGKGIQETEGLDSLSYEVLVVSPKKLVRVRVADAFVDVTVSRGTRQERKHDVHEQVRQVK